MSTSSSARLDRWGSGGGRGGGGGGTGGAESRCCGAVHRQGCVRPLAAQVPAVQGARAVHRQSAGHFGCAQRGVPTVQTVQKAVLASTPL